MAKASRRVEGIFMGMSGCRYGIQVGREHAM
jgi:hypothetical protein